MTAVFASVHGQTRTESRIDVMGRHMGTQAGPEALAQLH